MPVPAAFLNNTKHRKCSTTTLSSETLAGNITRQQSGKGIIRTLGQCEEAQETLLEGVQGNPGNFQNGQLCRHAFICQMRGKPLKGALAGTVVPHKVLDRAPCCASLLSSCKTGATVNSFSRQEGQPLHDQHRCKREALLSKGLLCITGQRLLWLCLCPPNPQGTWNRPITSWLRLGLRPGRLWASSMLSAFGSLSKELHCAFSSWSCIYRAIS